MHVDCAKAGPLEQCLRENQPECRYQQCIQVPQPFRRVEFARVLRLLDGDAVFHGCELDRARAHPAATAGRAIRLGKDDFDTVPPAPEHAPEHDGGKVGCSGESDAQTRLGHRAGAGSRSDFSIFLRSRCCFSGDR